MFFIKNKFCSSFLELLLNFVLKFKSTKNIASYVFLPILLLSIHMSFCQTIFCEESVFVQNLFFLRICFQENCYQRDPNNMLYVSFLFLNFDIWYFLPAFVAMSTCSINKQAASFVLGSTSKNHRTSEIFKSTRGLKFLAGVKYM